MNDHRYLKPPWLQRHIGNRMAVLCKPGLVAKLSVRGRRTGRRRTLPVVVLAHDGERYLVSYRGASDWALNLRASLTARLARRGRTEEITVAEMPVARRGPLLQAYLPRYGQMPIVAAVLRAPPDPAEHPVFQITGASAVSRAPGQGPQPRRPAATSVNPI